MKKIVLSLAGVLAATAFAPEASAIPSFARQTGMACNACHQQHFPVLNGFGQAFKAAGYTMMGAQGKVEGEHLSIPDTLNASMLLKARYVKEKRAGSGIVNQNSTGDGQWQIPDEFSLFFGGRVAENIGFMFEGNTAAAGLVAGFKLPFVFDMGSAKVLAVPYLTDALGVGYGFEQASTGAVRGVRWAEHRSDISAQQYVGIGAGAATGLAFVAQSDMGYINYSRWTNTANLANPTPPANATNAKLSANYVRIAATPTMGDWAMHIGAQFASGSVSNPGALLVAPQAKATAVDFQAFGQVGGKDLSVYAAWAKAPVDAVAGNIFNATNTTDRKAWTLGADYSVIPHALHIGLAYRNAENGGAAGATGDNSVTVTAVYDLTQNVALHLNHSERSGSAYNAANTGKTLTTFLLEAAW